MKLLDLLKGINPLDISGDINKDILGICYNSSLASKDFVFVAVKGYKTNGNLYIDHAIAGGAHVVITSENLPSRDTITVIKVKDTRKALSIISSNFYNTPSTNLNLIGITGTNGKTSTSYIIKSIFDEFHKNSCLIGTLGVITTEDSYVYTGSTTPESLELQKIFSQISNKNIENCIMEVSSHSIELQRVSNCSFDTAIFTNLSHEHLDFHGTMEEYYETKKKLFSKGTKNNIINIDDPYGARLYNELADSKSINYTYGINNKADFYAHHIELSDHGSSFVLETPNFNIRINSNLPGLYNIYNILAAVACSLINKIPVDDIIKSISSIRSIPGRFDMIPISLNRNIIIDYAHTPDAFEKLFQTMKLHKFRRLIIVFGCVGERDQSKRHVMGRIAAMNCDLCVLTTDNCRSENPSTILSHVIEGVKSVNGEYIKILDRKKAIEYAVESSGENDMILITGKGHETYQIIGNETFYFNEKEIIHALAKNK